MEGQGDARKKKENRIISIDSSFESGLRGVTLPSIIGAEDGRFSDGKEDHEALRIQIFIGNQLTS